MNRWRTIFTVHTDIIDRNVGLDIVRGIGLLMVFFGHSIPVFGYYFPFINVFSHLFRNGIELFFALSGFLIGNILIKQFVSSTDYSLQNLFLFYKRRWFRTLPLYYLGILINLFVGFFITQNYHDFNWKFLVFLQNFTQSSFCFYPVSYSLCIEEWFYLFFPFLFLIGISVFRNKPFLVMIAVCFIFIIVSTFIRNNIYNNQHFHWDTHMRKSIFTRLDSSVYGILLALFFNQFQLLFKKWKNILLLIGVFLNVLGMWFYLYHYESIWNNVFYFNIIPVSFVLFIPWFYYFKFNSPALNRLFTRLSLIAFAFYIIHLSPLMEVLNMFIKGQNIWVVSISFVVYTIVAFACATLLYLYFESPLTKLREKY